MFGKEADRQSGLNNTNYHMLLPFFPPDSHHSDIEMGHLQPKRERVEHKFNALTYGNTNKKIPLLGACQKGMDCRRCT